MRLEPREIKGTRPVRLPIFDPRPTIPADGSAVQDDRNDDDPAHYLQDRPGAATTTKQISPWDPLQGRLDELEVAIIRMRPIQTLYLIMLYKQFGLTPLGYHLVNALVLSCNVLLFHYCIVQLGQPRLISLSVPVVYILLPHYSTDRFWMSACQVPLSMAFYFLSLYCDLRAFDGNFRRFLPWKCCSVAAMLASALAYETVLPLFLINPLLVWYLAKGCRGRRAAKLERAATLFQLYAINFVIVVAVFAFKIVVSQRQEILAAEQHSIGYFLRLAYRVIEPIRRRETDYGFNIWQFLNVDLIDRGVKLPLLALEVFLRGYIDWPQAVAAGGLGILVFVHLRRAASREPDILTRPRKWTWIMAAGLAISLAGYAIFLTVEAIQFTLAGVGNRVSMSAAAGMAVVFVGAIGWIASHLTTERRRRVAFASLVALLATSACLVNYAIASFWITASQRQQVVLAAIQSHFPTLPTNGTLILDGMCPYVGPGIVFESSWDLAGALQLLYRDNTLRADVVTPKLIFKQDKIETTIYDEVTDYPYGPDVIIYNVARDLDRRLIDAASARNYVANIHGGPGDDCPPGSEGVGVPVL